MRWRGGSWAAFAVVLALLASGCGAGEAGRQGTRSLAGPDDTSNLWTALRWGIEVDYPNEPTVAALTAKADLVVRGRVVDVSRPSAQQDQDNALLTVEVERVLSDPDGLAPVRLTVAIPVNWDNDLERIDAEAPKPEEAILALSRVGRYESDGHGGMVDKSGHGPPLYGMITNDAILDFEGGVSYTPFNDLEGTPAPGDPFRGRTRAELETAFAEAAAS